MGNKADMEAFRVIDRASAEQLAKRYGLIYVEASAKTGAGVPEIFFGLTKAILDKRYLVVSQVTQQISIKARDPSIGC